jgi:hypothetical protein
MTSMTFSASRRRTMGVGLAGLGLLSLASCALDTGTATSGSSTTSGSTTGSSGSSSSGSPDFADGTYAVDAAYRAPSGTETVSVELTLVDGVITSVSTSADSSDREAAHFQSIFAGAISGAAVGRELSGLSVTRVAGASLTSTGFNSALEQIRAEASG